MESGRDKTSEAHKRFCELRKEVKRAQKSRYEQYIDDIGSEMKTNAKRFWTYVKSLKGTSSIPQIMTYCGNKLKTLSEITNGFNNFFKSVFKCDSDYIPKCKTRDVPLFRIKPILPQEMKQELKSLNPHTCTGSDNTPAVFLI